MDNQNPDPAGSSGEHIKLNVGGKLFKTTVSTLRFDGPDSLLSALSNRLAHDSVFIDRDPEIFSILLSLLWSNRLPSIAKRFSNQELIDEALYFGIESQLKSVLAPCLLNGIDASLFTTIKPSSDDVVSDFNAISQLLEIGFETYGSTVEERGKEILIRMRESNSLPGFHF